MKEKERTLGMEERWIPGEAVSGGSGTDAADMAETISAVNNYLVRRKEPDQAPEKEEIRPAYDRTEDAENLEDAARILSGSSLSGEEEEEISGMLLSLGLREEEVGRSLSEMKDDREKTDQVIGAIQGAEPYLHPEITDHSVRLHLEGRPVETIRVVEEENGKYLIVESDRVETKIRLPF